MRHRDSSIPSFLFLASLAANACAPADGTQRYSLAGVAQKGPFVLGSQITVAELDGKLVPTGRTFTTNIADDTGSFSLPDVGLASPFVSLTANGFFFDEVAGKLSASEIQLGAVSDVTHLTTLNVNLLSDLQRERVLTLIGGGKPLADAKQQAQHELLAVFGIQNDVAPAETLNIADGSPDDAALLAVSVILQSRRTPAELTEFLARLSADFAPDGKLDDQALGLQLAVGAELVDLAGVRANLTARYQQLGKQVTIGDFEPVVRSFVATTPFIPAGQITYPPAGAAGTNVLAPAVTSLPLSSPFSFSLAADVPAGKTVRVHLRASDDVFVSAGSDPANWEASFPNGEHEGDFTADASETGRVRDVKLEGIVNGGGSPSLTIDVYENGATKPTTSKTIPLQ